MINDSNNIQQLIERYNREMMEQYAQAVSNEPVVQEQPQDEEPPMNTEIIEETPTNSENDRTDVGQLQVRVSTENQAVPIPGAVITITDQRNGNNNLIRTLISDDNGLTPFIDLPTVDRRFTLSPDNPNPYAVYTVDVSATGYFPKRFLNLPIYGGVAAIQSVSMIPLPENGSDDTILTYPESGPFDL